MSASISGLYLARISSFSAGESVFAETDFGTRSVPQVAKSMPSFPRNFVTSGAAVIVLPACVRMMAKSVAPSLSGKRSRWPHNVPRARSASRNSAEKPRGELQRIEAGEEAQVQDRDDEDDSPAAGELYVANVERGAACDDEAFEDPRADRRDPPQIQAH